MVATELPQFQWLLAYPATSKCSLIIAKICRYYPQNTGNTICGLFQHNFDIILKDFPECFPTISITDGMKQTLASPKNGSTSENVAFHSATVKIITIVITFI